MNNETTRPESYMVIYDGYLSRAFEAGLSTDQALILNKIYSICVNYPSGTCSMSTANLSAIVNVSYGTLRNALSKLYKLGFITYEKHGKYTHKKLTDKARDLCEQKTVLKDSSIDIPDDTIIFDTDNL